MQLYLMRHGEADSELTDGQRLLSDRRRNDIQRVAALVKANIGITVNTVFHSGKTRARETAQMFSSYVTLSDPIEIDDHLSPNADPEIWKDRLVGERENLMLVGHLPHLNRLVPLFVGGGGGVRIRCAFLYRHFSVPGKLRVGTLAGEVGDWS